MHEPKAPVAPLKFDRENVRAAVQKSGAIRRPGTTHEPELSTKIEHTNELQASRERSARRWAGTQLRGKTGGQLLLFTGASAADGSSPQAGGTARPASVRVQILSRERLP